MELRITSMETVRPFPPEINALKPFKLSFLDQLFSPYYVPVIFFFTPSNSSAQFDSAQISAQLKNSLSKALNVFYPLSGRVVDNCCIDYYKEGVPFVEARVNGCASDYLQPIEVDKLNDLLPCESFVYQSNPKSLPLLAVQLNVFDCGGIALALCGSHKIMDASTAISFVRSWAAFSQGFNGEISKPDLLGASSRLLPPMDQVPPEILSTIKSRYFKEGRYKTKTFVFDANAIATLMFKAKCKRLDRPSQAEALTAFIWKHAMLASRSASGVVKPSICTQVVNLRRRLKPRLADYSIGNLAWPSASICETSMVKDIELHDLALRLRNSLENLTAAYEGDNECANVIYEQVNQLGELISKLGDVEMYGFSSWLNFRMYLVDFGWGKPSRVGIPGLVGPAFCNFTYLKHIGEGKAVEAWVTLEETHMAMLERDPGFLAFASPNPHYDKSKI